MDLLVQMSSHSTRPLCFLLLIFEFSIIISDASAISRTSLNQPSGQIIVGRPFKKNDNNRLHQAHKHLSHKSQEIEVREDGYLKSLIASPLNVNETSRSLSFVDSLITTQPAIGDHSLADDALFDSDNNSDAGSFDTSEEPKIEGK